MDDVFRVRPVRPSEAAYYRELRLLALRLHPEAFGSSFAEESLLVDDVFAELLAGGAVFGAWLNERLVACAGLALRERTKLRHKRHLWGMFVRPEARGRGVGKHLLNEVLVHSRKC